DLQKKIVEEDANVEKDIQIIVTEWDLKKPIQGSTKPADAIEILNEFKGREKYDTVCRAKEALNMASTSEARLEPVREELEDLQSVWNALFDVWKSIDKIKEALWSSVVPRKIRQQLDALLTTTKEMPTRMRSYAAFEYVQDTIKQYIKINPILAELKSEALKERHWKQLFKVLPRTNFLFSEMTIGHVWDFDLKKNEQIIKDVVAQASGEMALEEFLKQ
ncbi:1323_t:CDS:2, partial [Acaulospora colombiana]